MGASGQVVIDKYYRVYSGAGPSTGISFLLSGSVTANWMAQTSEPSSRDIYSFIVDDSYGFSGGFVGSANVSWNSSGQKSYGGGIGVPGVDANYTETQYIGTITPNVIWELITNKF